MPELPEVDPVVDFRVSSSLDESFYSRLKLANHGRFSATVYHTNEPMHHDMPNNLESSLPGRDMEGE